MCSVTLKHWKNLNLPIIFPPVFSFSSANFCNSDACRLIVNFCQQFQIQVWVYIQWRYLTLVVPTTWHDNTKLMLAICFAPPYWHVRDNNVISSWAQRRNSTAWVRLNTTSFLWWSAVKFSLVARQSLVATHCCQRVWMVYGLNSDSKVTKRNNC